MAIALDTNTDVGFKRGDVSCVEVFREAEQRPATARNCASFWIAAG